MTTENNNSKNQPKIFETDEQKKEKVVQKEQAIVTQGANGQWKPRWQTPAELFSPTLELYSQTSDCQSYLEFENQFMHWQNIVRCSGDREAGGTFLWRHPNMPKSEYAQVFNALKVSGWTIEAVPSANGTQTYVKRAR